ncbi:MAG TPA: class I adenylate-forming enzyme family protein [Streptosporangiaceae bacterium]|jgi:acyl-CoA synthetase
MYRDLVGEHVRNQWIERGFYPGRDVYSLVWEHAQKHPDKVAIDDARGPRTYRELCSDVERTAAILRQEGIQAGDIVAFQLPNGRETPTVEYAIMSIGAISLPCPMPFRGPDLHKILDRAGAAAIVTTTVHDGHDHAATAVQIKANLGSLRRVFVIHGEADGTIPVGDALNGAPQLPGAAPDPISSSLPARVVVTSGTESDPKLMLYSHDVIAGGIGNQLRHMNVGPDSKVLFGAPLSSAFGTIALPVLARHGGTLLLTDKLTPTRLLTATEQKAATHLLTVPTLVYTMLDEIDQSGRPAQTPSLAVIATYGATYPKALVMRTQAAFRCDIVNAYGCSDGGGSQTHPGDAPDIVAETVGRPDEDICSIRIVGADETDVPAGAIGQIYGRGPICPLSYLNAPELDERYRTADGWTRTGDLGYLDEAGYLRVVGRAKDVIVRNGTNVSPAELENIISDHPDVAMVACVGLPHERAGEQIAVFVTLRPSAPPLSLESLRDYLTGRNLTRYKLPDQLRIVDEFPLTTSGKILKRRLIEAG